MIRDESFQHPPHPPSSPCALVDGTWAHASVLRPSSDGPRARDRSFPPYWKVGRLYPAPKHLFFLMNHDAFQGIDRGPPAAPGGGNP